MVELDLSGHRVVDICVGEADHHHPVAFAECRVTFDIFLSGVLVHARLLLEYLQDYCLLTGNCDHLVSRLFFYILSGLQTCSLKQKSSCFCISIVNFIDPDNTDIKMIDSRDDWIFVPKSAIFLLLGMVITRSYWNYNNGNGWNEMMKYRNYKNNSNKGHK